MLMFWPAARKNRLLIRCITCSFLLVLDLRMATTAALSQRHRTAPPLHMWPQMAMLRTTGSSSFTVMCHSSQLSGHFSWNHSPDDAKAQHPHDPDASEVTVATKPHFATTDIIPVTFHDGRNRPHH